jgi:hypothetical protein
MLGRTGTVALTRGQWYTSKVVIDWNPNDPSGTGQRLRFWVETDEDGDFGLLASNL